MNSNLVVCGFKQEVTCCSLALRQQMAPLLTPSSYLQMVNTERSPRRCDSCTLHWTCILQQTT